MWNLWKGWKSPKGSFSFKNLLIILWFESNSDAPESDSQFCRIVQLNIKILMFKLNAKLSPIFSISWIAFLGCLDLVNSPQFWFWTSERFDSIFEFQAQQRQNDSESPIRANYWWLRLWIHEVQHLKLTFLFKFFYFFSDSTFRMHTDQRRSAICSAL